MGKRRRELDFNGTTSETEEYNTVFVDTSLDTHLIMRVYKSDTVSYFKKKMMLEHMKCFPKFEEIRIHSLKIKRKNHYYHLSDTMHVASAFEGVKGNWFISVDAYGNLSSSNNSSHHANPDLTQKKAPEITVCSKKRRRKRAKKLEAVVDEEEMMMDKGTKNSTDIIHADFPVLEKENQILDSNLVENDIENTADFPVVENENQIRDSKSEGTSMFSVKFETDVASSPVLSLKNDESLKEKHEIVVHTDDVARITEDDGEDINFKHYFLPDQNGDYLKKSSLQGSKGETKMSQPENKNLLTKAGTIFQDIIDESSGDENRTASSSCRTRSSSDSSSMSDHSVGGSNLSQDSTRNGSSDAKERPTGEKDTSKLQWSENMTLHMILRSSKRFKKAKLIAEQNETDPIQFVPDSLPN